jgi:Fur family ferric uptake transcriptional regulator
VSDALHPNAAGAVPEDLLITPICAIFRRFLKRQGLKFTTERAQTLDVVLGKEGVFEAEDLLEEMKAAGHRVSRATVYRTLKHLLEAGIIREVLIDSNRAHYELAFGRAPKGHLVCVETQRIVEFPTTELNALM